MKKVFLLALAAISIFFQSCSRDDNSGPRVISTQTFSFSTAIDPSTLSVQQAVHLSSPTSTRPETLVISTKEELTAFIQMTNEVNADAYYQNMFSSLDTHTYLLIKGPSCPDYYQYLDYQYNPPVLSIRMNHFIRDNGACAAVFFDTYYVLKGIKT